MGNIVWLSSYPKSGNTWLRAFIANLVADARAPLAFDTWPRYAVDEANPERFSRVAGAPSTDLDVDALCRSRVAVQADIAAAARGTVFVKTHNLAGSFDGHALQNWTVTAGAIYVIRNPLDVCISFAAHFGLTLDTAIARMADANLATGNDALFVSEIIGSWSQHVASWAALEARGVLLVRYEDMLDKPLKTFTRVARMLKLGDDRARIMRAIEFSDFKRLQRMERSDGFREAVSGAVPFFRKGLAKQWRERLGREQVARIIADHREVMRRFNYLPAGY
ncbi:sulfotransferase domain-containing protein [Metallibacterium scheffleri]|uniref:Sulfotransferase domain-containing protein n=1 Tax=Metallibacterium scheffleri TaxID=993689 RepID=A0A4S3KLE0_9GAMM|nr:sulfotransferase domain-containing protein [Metallibacterium scheffleri]THD09685.1 hypothetical protein B1806_10145 [Metallibacterium scheffleri]